MKIMECMDCKKEIDVEKNSIPAQWCGLYMGWKILAVICVDCRKKPENAEWWLDARKKAGM